MQKDKIKKYIRIAILVFMVLAFSKILNKVFTNEIVQFDNDIYSMLAQIKSDNITNVFKIITNFGSALAIISVIILSFIWLENKKYAKYITLNLVIIVILNQVIKFIIQRPRPVENRIINQFGYSFPSGHSMVSMAFYGFIIYLIYKKVNNKFLKVFLNITLMALILLIGVSRIYLGVHYASDVLAGFCFSIGYLTIFTMILKDKLLKIDKTV